MMRTIVLAAALALAQTAHAAPMSTPHTGNAIYAFEPDSFQQIVAAHAKQPFVVLIWSLDCAYCQASMEALSALQKKRPLSVVTIATDDATDAETRRALAAKVEATRLAAQKWAFGDAAPEQLRYAIDPAWRGELPRTYWFDVNGRRHATSGIVTPAMIDRFVSHVIAP